MLIKYDTYVIKLVIINNAKRLFILLTSFVTTNNHHDLTTSKIRYYISTVSVPFGTYIAISKI